MLLPILNLGLEKEFSILEKVWKKSLILQSKICANPASITRKSETLVDDEPAVDLFISDHAAMFNTLGLSRPGLSVKNHHPQENQIHKPTQLSL